MTKRLKESPKIAAATSIRAVVNACGDTRYAIEADDWNSATGESASTQAFLNALVLEGRISKHTDDQPYRYSIWLTLTLKHGRKKCPPLE